MRGQTTILFAGGENNRGTPPIIELKWLKRRAYPRVLDIDRGLSLR